MSAAYVIASYDIVDPPAYEGYVPAVIPLLQKYGAEVLVADYDAKPLEGDRRSVFVVLRFESEERALAWYGDPDYEGPKAQRIGASTNASLVLARQFDPPAG